MSAILMSVLLACLGAPGEVPPVAPLRWGVDDAGGPPELETYPWAGRMMKEFGFDLWVSHRPAYPRVAQHLESIRRVDAWCARAGLQWIANLESANWIAKRIDDQGRDWYNRADGRHFELIPEDVLQIYGEAKQLLGIMYDEAAHMQNCRNMILNKNQPFRPWIYDPAGDTLEGAADGFTKATAEVAAYYGKFGVPLYTEHVFPVLYHGFARAGWTPCTKILKENRSPAFIACVLGAALQYGKPLCITPDLWGIGGGYPDHALDEYRSALLLAYHMGAETIYTENLAYDHERKGVGSLILVKGDDYEVTPYGEVTQDFIHNYVPAHPRRYSFRDLKPRVAIVRQPDACWGQKKSWLGDRLFGNDDWPSNDTTEAWLKIWHLLSLGVIPPEGLSWHTAGPYTKLPYQVFHPLEGVVVFDHHVRAERLRGAEVIFLTGLGVSPETQQDVAALVQEGATCVALPHLVPERVREGADRGVLTDGKGLWVVTDDFLSSPVREHVAHVLPAEHHIRYQFGDNRVTFRPEGGDPNRLTVSVDPSAD